MRLSISFYTNLVPISQGFLISSLIKEALNKVNKDYCSSLYYYEKKNSNKRTKNFCTSTYLEDYEILENEIKINGKIILNISSPDMHFMTNIYNGLLKIQEFQYKDYKLIRGKITYQRENIILNSTVNFKTLSPIIIKTKENKFIGPEDKNYESELNYITNLILNNYRGYGLKEKLSFKVLDIKKTIIKEEIEEFTANTEKKYFYITGYRGIFKLAGDIEDLNDIYRLGIGYRRGQNAGMVEAI